jgi:PAS domain S-box-containing protein
MIAIFDSIRNLKKQYFLFIGTIVLTILAMQFIIQRDLNLQDEDARLINIAGRQRMLGQRISKLTLYIENDFQATGKVPQNRLDTLSKLVTTWESVHFSLQNGNSDLGVPVQRSPRLDSLLTTAGVPLKEMVNDCKFLLKEPIEQNVKQAVATITKHELTFLYTMEAAVATFQSEAEEKLHDIKFVELSLSGAAVIIIFLEFIYIFLPMVKGIEENNIKLTELNRELNTTNEELQSTEEELRSNLDYVTVLQEEVEAREKQYREVIDNASDMIYELNADGKFAFVNPVMQSITEYSKEELLQKSYWEIIQPEHIQAAIEFYKEQRKSKKEFTYYDLPILTRSGQNVWVGQNVTMFFHNEKVFKVSVIARDITKLKEAQQKIAESERLYRLISNNSKDLITLYDSHQTDPRRIFVSPSVTQILGYEPDELIGKSPYELIVEEDAERMKAEVHPVTMSGRTASTEYRIRRKDGTIIWLQSNSNPFFDEKGTIIGFQTSARDITALKQAQLKVVESEKLYRNLSENSQDLTTLNDIHGNFVYISAAVTALLGFSVDHLIGTSPENIMHRDDIGFYRQVIAKTIRQKTPQKIEYRLRRKEGNYIWLDTYIHPTHNKDGQITGFQTTSRDISLRKDFEKALEEAKNKAEEATRAKSQFLSMMSHEIRTPMNAVIGLSNLLIQESPRPEQLENLKLLKFSGENLLTIINDILDFSKIEAGKLELEIIDFDLKNLLSNTINMLDQRAQDKGITVHFKYDDSLPTVFKGDQVRLGQIVTNLVGNAVKFTERGYVELKVEVRSQADNRYTLNIAVKDTGIGIDPDKIKMIFDSFSQASSDTTRKFGGTGLGLSITKKLLNMMGSSIDVTSAPGFGSTFSFDLNLPAGNSENLKNIITTYASANVHNNNIKVLLVEDNRVNQVVATNFLKKWGIKVDLANHGKEALEMISSKDYQLVLMDLQMPEMDGYEATKKIREKSDSYFKNVPIIALTASAMLDIKDKVLLSGMNDFISKPFQPEELKSKIEKYAQTYVAQSEPSRSYSVSLDLYSEGDAEFKRELASLLVKNIQELQSALEEAIENNDAEIFRKASHKVKTTISMLGDHEFSDLVDSIKESLSRQQLSHPQRVLFNDLAGKIIAGLQEEIRSM